MDAEIGSGEKLQSSVADRARLEWNISRLGS